MLDKFVTTASSLPGEQNGVRSLLFEEHKKVAGTDKRFQYEYTEGNGLRLTSITDQNAPSSPTAVYSKVEFSYDDRGRLVLLKEAIRGQVSFN